ncbi:MAG: sigma 54-interacting transcriptional regulator [Candidatus Sumerlaeia bacterium]|nr:sigma 54-interacting transcriptional regulator [Candidatus Sumerlaeia bacterium]
MNLLSIITGEAAGTRCNLEKEPVVIGRGRECTVQLRDPMVSRRHARVFFSKGAWWVEDLGSRNGTLVNGQKIVSAKVLRAGDRVEIGETVLVFESDEAVPISVVADEAQVAPDALEDTDFEDSVGPLWFREQAFDANSLEILYRIASILNAGLGLPHLVRESVGAIRAFFKANTASLFLTETVKPPVQPTLILSDEATPLISQRVVCYSLRTRRAVCVRDTRVELPADDILNLAGGETGRSVMCAPLIHRERGIGAILIDHLKPNYFDHHSLIPFTAIAHLIGGGIFQAQQMERLESAARMAGEGGSAVRTLSGISPAIDKLHRRIAEVAASEEPVLIVGECGSGKHEAAHAIHAASPRQNGPLVWFHVLSTKPEDLEAALFGISESESSETAQTGAGKIEAAHGGTLVIEEIGALPSNLQRALLAYLKTLKFQRVGSQRRYFADTRLIATTSRPLDEAVLAGTFDPELFAAIGVLTVAVPPLRNRREDIIELARGFARQIAPHAGRPDLPFTTSFSQALLAYSWPGNVRELRSVVERAVFRCQGDKLTIADLPADLVESAQRAVVPTQVDDTIVPTPAGLQKKP